MPKRVWKASLLIAIIMISSSSLAIDDGKITFPLEYFKDLGKPVERIAALLKDPGAVSDERRDKDNKLLIRSYSKYDEAADLVSVCAVVRLDIPFDKVSSAYFINSADRANWVNYTKEVRLQAVTDKVTLSPDTFGWTNTEWIIGDRVVWFISARGFVLTNHVVANRKEKWIAQVGVSLEKPEVFIPHLEAYNAQFDQLLGQFLFLAAYAKSIEDGKATQMVIGILVDPKGSIPKFVVRMGAKSWPVATYDRFKDYLEKQTFPVTEVFATGFDPKKAQKIYASELSR